MARNSIAPGGYIGGEPPRRPMFNQLSGVWKLDDAMERQRAGTWANPLGIEDLFSTFLYTGNNYTQTITNGIDLSGKGGMIWVKSRSNSAWSWNQVDTERGNMKILFSNRTDASYTDSQSFQSFNSNGFTIQDNASLKNNDASNTYASWTFRKQAKFFDVVTYTGNGTSQSIAHNLGSEPGFVIIKATSTSSNWVCYHRSLGTGNAVFLNLTNGSTAASDISAVSSTTFSVSGNQPRSNESGQTYVAYLFAHDAGGFGDSGNESVIKCGSFTPDGSGNATVNLGWEPQWVLYKRTNGSENWKIVDNMRGFVVGSGNDAYLFPNTSEAEVATTGISPLSTGFTIEGEASSSPYIYIAIRRGPMKAPTDATKVFSAILSSGSVGTTATTGFPVDAQIMSQQGASGKLVHDRLRGVSSNSTESGRFLNTTSADAENSTLPYTLGWSNEGFKIATYWAGIFSVYWNFRRAPGFFDVVAYTGTGVAGQTIQHNLGVAPELMLVKSRNFNAFWRWYWAPLGATKNFYMPNDEASVTQTEIWNNTAPTSSVFSLGNSFSINGNGNTFVAYLFASCPGVSKVGSYTGTGAAQTIDCGFKNGARFVMIKRTDSTGDWSVWDSARGIFFGTEPELRLNTGAAQTTNTNNIEPASVGFAISNISLLNANGGSYIFLAIA